MTAPRMEPPEGSQPAGEGFGRPWVTRELTFFAEGAVVRSVLNPVTGKGMVAVDLGGRWRGSQEGTDEPISILMHRDVAQEFGEYMRQAVAAAGEDEAVWRAQHR